MGALSQLADLDVSGNKIQSLPLALTACRALTRLNVVNNALTVLPAMLSNLQHLTQLAVAHNKLTALPDELCGLAQLTELNASHNRITVLPAELGKLVALTELDVAHNRLREFPDSILALAALTVLDATSNNVTFLPVGFGAALPNLTTLKMKDNQLKSLPADVGLLAALQILDVENHRVKSWPASTSALTNLTTVTTKTTYTTTASGKNVTRLDPDLTGSPAVRLISNTAAGGIATAAEYAAIATMRNAAAGPGVSQADAQRYFDWQYGATPAEQYLALQDEFPGSMTMQQILADGNIEKAFVTKTFKAEWDKIALGITGNEYKLKHDETLYRIPSNLATQGTVAKIDLKGCNIQAIPTFVTQMRLLTSLNLGNNDLRSVPDALKNLTGLTNLYLGYNKLKTLPDLSALVNLTRFGVEDNKLTQFPAWLAAHTTVQSVNMGGNGTVGRVMAGTRQAVTVPNLSGMTALTNLALYRCGLITVPVLPPVLTDLSLGENYLSSAAALDRIAPLTALKHLELRKNQFTNVIGTQSWSGLTALTDLDFSENRLKSFSINRWPTSLKNVNLSYNSEIWHLKSEWARLVNLTNLDLSHCSIFRTTSFVLPNTNVQVNFANNKLSYVPELRTPKPGAPGKYILDTLAKAKSQYVLTGNVNIDLNSEWGRWFWS